MYIIYICILYINIYYIHIYVYYLQGITEFLSNQESISFDTIKIEDLISMYVCMYTKEFVVDQTAFNQLIRINKPKRLMDEDAEHSNSVTYKKRCEGRGRNIDWEN